MVFIKQDIPSKILCIIDIGSYKLRVCAASFKNKRIEVLGYHEKRQDTSYFSNQECSNLPGLCKNISETIEKLEKDLHISIEELVINYPFGEIFLASKTIHQQRKNKTKEIHETELESLFEFAQQHCLKQLSAQIEETYSIASQETHILLSRINSVSLDGVREEKLLHKTGAQVSLSLVNAFIPLAKHNLLAQISNVLGKKIYRILPTEFCIAKIFPQEDIVLINIGATQTSITLKQENEVRAISKVSIGINDLVHKISKRSDFSKAEIIEKLSGDDFIQEKNQFVQIWGEALGITLQEILKHDLCPKYFYIGGGGGNNGFILEYLKNFSFARYNIRIVNHLEIVSEDLTDLFKIMKSIQVDDIQKIPLDVYVLLSETNTLITQEQDIMSISLKKALERLGYIKA